MKRATLTLTGWTWFGVQVPVVGVYTVRWARWEGVNTTIPPLLKEDHASYTSIKQWSVRVIAGSYTVASTAVTLGAAQVQVCYLERERSCVASQRLGSAVHASSQHTMRRHSVVRGAYTGGRRDRGAGDTERRVGQRRGTIC